MPLFYTIHLIKARNSFFILLILLQRKIALIIHIFQPFNCVFHIFIGITMPFKNFFKIIIDISFHHIFIAFFINQPIQYNFRRERDACRNFGIVPYASAQYFPSGDKEVMVSFSFSTVLLLRLTFLFPYHFSRKISSRFF